MFLIWDLSLSELPQNIIPKEENFCCPNLKTGMRGINKSRPWVELGT